MAVKKIKSFDKKCRKVVGVLKKLLRKLVKDSHIIMRDMGENAERSVLKAV